MIVLSLPQDLLVKSRTAREGRGSAILAGRGILNSQCTFDIKVLLGTHSNNVSCESSILYIRMTVPFMGVIVISTTRIYFQK